MKKFAAVILTMPILTMMVLFPQTRAALATGITGKAETGDLDQRAAEKYGPALTVAAQASGTDVSPVVSIPAGTKLTGYYDGFTLAAPISTQQTIPTTARIRDAEGREFDIPLEIQIGPSK